MHSAATPQISECIFTQDHANPAPDEHASLPRDDIDSERTTPSPVNRIRGIGDVKMAMAMVRWRFRHLEM